MGIGLIACAGSDVSPKYSGAASTIGVAESGPPQDVPAGDLHRIAGDANIVPDDAIKSVIAGSCDHELLGVFWVCITRQGTIASVYPLRTTGFSG